MGAEHQLVGNSVANMPPTYSHIYEQIAPTTRVTHSLVSPCVQLLGDVVKVLLVGPHKHKARGAEPRQGQPFKPGGSDRVGGRCEAMEESGAPRAQLQLQPLPHLPRDLSSGTEASSPLPSPPHLSSQLPSGVPTSHPEFMSTA